MNDRAAGITVATERISDQLLNEAAVLYADEPHKISIWRWQFRERFGQSALAITARCDGKLVGFNGTMPVKLWAAGKELDAYWSCDFIVDGEFRGQGIGGKIKDEMNRAISQPIMSLGISDSALPILLKKGWQEADALPVAKKVCRPESWRDAVIGSLGMLHHALAGFRHGRRPGPPLTFDLMEALPAQELVDALWKNHRPENQLTVIRDHEYLAWRYHSYPLPAYHFLLGRQEDDPCCLVVYRASDEGAIEVVDYLGPSDSYSVVLQITRQLCRANGNVVKSIVWSTSSETLRKQLTQCGFITRRYATRFAYNAKSAAQDALPWELSAGDSDGDFIKVAREFHERKDSAIIEAIPVDESRLSASREAWNALLKDSRANPLFMSWEWQNAWWKTWGENRNYLLSCLYLYTKGKLVGILPLYRLKRRRWLLREIHFIGNAWRVEPTVRSEYISPLFRLNEEARLRQFFANWIGRQGLDACVISPDSHPDYRDFYAHGSLTRQVDIGYRVATSGSLDTYVSSLGAQTRLKAFNRLKYLENRYDSVVWGECPLDRSSIEAFFEQLNEFHKMRWGNRCFNDSAVAFHIRLIQSVLESDSIVPVLHFLKVDGTVVSVSYNLIASGVMYNLQSGYLEDFDKKVSLGTLHFGKLIALCFESETIEYLDMLAGGGKHTDYKKKFNGESLEFSTLQFFSNPGTARFYRAVRALKPTIGWIRRRGR